MIKPLRQHASLVWVGKLKALLVVSLCLLCLSACAIKPLKPWLKPYERQNLADPIMSFDAHPVQGSYMHHVFQGRESARGAEGGAGGGCGCN